MDVRGQQGQVVACYLRYRWMNEMTARDPGLFLEYESDLYKVYTIYCKDIKI
ncbi:MAG: hypothetical protein Sylvanvirus34_3 [Sylvanvirus sp.]|uniref:Uncharacterized protein n=1 Tax=Sylvanvirus sp. TaxID=2487774 RepID=A0A3G5AJW9_9VIRU|nr:MAG: hypothetical protein Sylvanvirus34_3 [Sylvanvirus sp.]